MCSGLSTRGKSRPRGWSARGALAAALWLVAATVAAEGPPAELLPAPPPAVEAVEIPRPSPSVEELAERLRALEADHALLLDQLDRGVAEGTAGRAIRQTQFQPRLDERSGSLSPMIPAATPTR